MNEIPRDGKSYLAWHKKFGCLLVYCGKGSIYYREAGESKNMELKEFARWMDECGQWHEVFNDESDD